MEGGGSKERTEENGDYKSGAWENHNRVRNTDLSRNDGEVKT